jgi:hypothetical protein
LRGIGIATSNYDLLYTARDAANPAHPSASPMVAVLFSAFWLEAYTNNVLESLSWYVEQGTKLPRRLVILGTVASELETHRAQLPEKVQMISAVLLGRAFDRGKQPHQDFELLLAIRHRLVHSRTYRIARDPDSNGLVALGEPKKLRQGLMDRGILHRTADRGFSWDVALNRPALGTWAYATANEMTRAIGDCFPRGRWRSWAHAINPLSPESQRMMRRSRPVPRPPTSSGLSE